jgi:hypothetical protein
MARLRMIVSRGDQLVPRERRSQRETQLTRRADQENTQTRQPFWIISIRSIAARESGR